MPLSLADIGRAEMPLNLPPSPEPPVWGAGGSGYNGFGTAGPLIPTSVPSFTGQAPTPKTFADFSAPNPADVLNDPTIQWQLDQGNKALSRSALSRGTFLTGDTAKALAEHSQNFAASKYGDLFDRAMAAYTANRGTNAQNFGQSMDAFTGDLNAFNANTNAALGFGNLGINAANSAYDRQYQAGRDAYGDEVSRLTLGSIGAPTQPVTPTPPSPLEQFAQSVAMTRPSATRRQWWQSGPDRPR